MEDTTPIIQPEDSRVQPKCDVDINLYQYRKTVAEGLLNLALLSANANQLRYILEKESTHPYYYTSITMIGISLLLQLAVVFLLSWNTRYNINKGTECKCRANRINNHTVVVIVLIAIINALISSFTVTNGRH